MYGVTKPLEFRYYAFFDEGGGSWTASLYSETGEWVADRLAASPGISDSPGGGVGLFLNCIVGDPAEVVGDGALVGRSSDDTITVWDVASEATFTYTAADGKHVSLVRITGGKLYWWEYMPTNPGPNDTLDYTLKRSSFDLSDASDVGTYSSPGWPAGSDTGPSRLQLSETTLRAKFKDANFVLVALATGIVTSDSDSCGAHSQPVWAWPDSAGAAIGPHDPRVRSMPLDFTCNSSARWPMPSGGTLGVNPWQIGKVTTDHVQSFGVSADRTVGLILGLHEIADGSDREWAVEALTTATAGDPIISTQVHAHPTLAVTPTALFLKV